MYATHSKEYNPQGINVPDIVDPIRGSNLCINILRFLEPSVGVTSQI